jgi:uncharacterized protein (TIGR02246 family)
MSASLPPKGRRRHLVWLEGATKSAYLPLALAIVALAGCDGMKRERKDAGNVDTATIEKQLKDNEAKWNRAYAEHDAKALAGAYADDAALANPGAPIVTGAEAIRKEAAAFAADPNLKVEFAADRIQVAASGDLAYTRGHYTLIASDPLTKKPVTSAGSYLTVWQKQADGSFKAVEDFVTPGPPTP